MFTRSTTHAVHSLRNSNPLRNAEEEFGMLKRQLERREQKRGNGMVLQGASDDAAWQQEISDATGVGGPPAPLPIDTSMRSRPDPAPLFAEDDAKLDVVRRAHHKHNRAVITHNTQWDDGHHKLVAMVEANDAEHTELEGLISSAKAAQNNDPPTVESATTTSNYTAIREAVRSIAACGNNIDSSDSSPNNFDFLFSDATLGPRERVMLQRIRDLSAKLKTVSTALATAKECAVQDKMMYEGQLNDERQTHRDRLAELQQEWEEQRDALRSDVEHWESSSVSLQQSLTAAREQLERERQEAAAALTAAVTQRKAETATWMQTVALGDREMHKLKESVRDLELQVAGSSSVVSRLQSEVASTQAVLERVTGERESLADKYNRLESKFQAVSTDVALLRAAKPEVTDGVVQVDTNTIIADMRDVLTSTKSDLSRLRLSNDHLQKSAAALEAELRVASTFKHRYEEAEASLQRVSSALENVTKQQQRDHKRRMQLVCENYCLRSMITVLQRPNGFGDLMENLQTENRWLMSKLERRTPLRVVTAGGAEHTTHGSITQPRMVVERHGDDHITGDERDVVIRVADASAQTESLSWQRCSSEPMIWKCAANQCTEDLILRESMQAVELRRSAALAEYISNSETRRTLERAVGGSRAIQLASHRFRRAMDDERRPNSALNGAEYNEDDVVHQRGAPSAGMPQRSSRGSCDLSESSNSDGTLSPQRSEGHAAMQRPPRPSSATSLLSSAPSTDAPTSKRTGKYATESGALPQAQADYSRSAPQLCVFGVHDTPQKSALSGKPTQYFSLKRSEGLSGAAGKRREFDLSQHAALERAVVVEEPNREIGRADSHMDVVRGPSFMPSTTPVRTLGEQQPKQQLRPRSALSREPSPATAERPRSALIARTTPMHSFMPAQRSALGSWKHREQ